MTLVYSIILYVFGFVLFISKKKEFILSYLILWVCFAPLLYHLIIGFDDVSNYYNIIQWAKYLGLTIFLFSFKIRNIKFFSILYVLLFIVLLYSIFLSLYRGVSIFSTVKFVFGSFFEVLILLGLYKSKINKDSLVKLFNFILIVEVFFAIFQYFTGFRFYPVYNDIAGAEVSGTFIGANLLSEFVPLILYVLIYIEDYKKRRISAYHWVLFFLVSFMVFISGVRMALICHTLISTILVIKVYRLNLLFKRNPIPMIVISSILVYFGYMVFSSFLGQSEVSFDNQVSSAVERQNVLTSIFLQDDYLSEHTTLYYTFFVLSFLPNNPIFGPGLLYMSPSGYGGVVNSTSSALTDCTMAIYICESGIIGVLLFILIYTQLIKKLCHNSFGAKLLLAYLLILTITDPGIFFVANYLIFISLILIGKQNELSTTGFKKVLQPSV